MREIKFRAWNKNERFMIRNYVELTSNSYNWWGVDFTKGRTTLEIMQYTGFKDKNGKEIYEGDIVKHHQGVDEIKWVTDGWRVGTWEPDYLGGFSVEVIGNIYENQELLEEEV